MQRGRVELSGRRKHPVRPPLLGLWQQVDLFDFTLDILLLLLLSKSCPPSRLIPPWPLETILNWDCPLFPLVHPFSSSWWWWSNFAKLVPLKIATQNNKICKKIGNYSIVKLYSVREYKISQTDNKSVDQMQCGKR